MTASFGAQGVADWLFTFALHSTLVLGITLLLGAVLRNRAIGFQEGALRLSLWAALVSSSVQYLALGSPWPFFELPPSDVLLSGGGLFAGEPAAAPVPLVTTAPEVVWSWPIVVVATAAGLGVLGLLWLWSVWASLHRVLALRQPDVDSRVLAMAATVARELGLRQSPHVSTCDLIATPIAFGWIRPEICLPARACELEDASLRAMLAHEIAHLRRGDPGWMWLAAWLQALFPWQVLFLAVRRRWARLIEFRCDAIAAHHSSPTAVARCLLDVAEWLRPESGTPVVALGMAARASSLRERIEAALKPQRPSRPHRLLAIACSGVSLSALTLVAPGVAATEGVPAASALTGAPLTGAPLTGAPLTGAPLTAGAPTGIVAEPPAPAAFAAMDARIPAASPSRTAVRLLQQEHAELVAEVASLRADLEGRRKSPELEQLVSMLTHRLLVLERLSARLRVRLDRRDIEVVDSPR
ncbi:MAG TPA: M56 family metallopeptidase [Planctomycetota bacterium]|nr:M56 family metallopeptidase [Planctomycetota bacterium]